MARYLGPKHKICRRTGLPLCGSQNCPVLKKNYRPGQHRVKRSQKPSDYAIRLLEKQKAKRIYGILEKQFRRYFATAAKQKAATGEVLLQLLETRLDNLVYRLGFAKSRRLARQLVSHGHILVNDKKVNVASYQVKPDDIIALSQNALEIPVIVESLKLSKNGRIPSWLKREGPKGKVLRLPKRSEIGEPISENLIVEYYSR